MTPCEILGNNARYLDARADTTPHGLIGTPFGVVSDALRVVAASAWNVDPTVYRAGIAWAWYLGARPSALAVDGFRALLCAALVSECAPLVRESQTVGELVALLSVWMDYRPVFADMEALFVTYGVRVDVRAISDPEGQALLPVDDTRLAFYIFVLSMDWQRPMLLGEIAETARRASPLGARPFVVYYVEGSISVPVACAPTDGFLWVDVWESAVQPIPPAPVLPTVSVTGDFGNHNWLYSQPGQTTYANVSAGDFVDVYYSGATVTYDSAKCYAIQKWFTTEATSGYEGINGVFSVINDNGSIALKNESSAEKSIFSARCAVCSSSQATVVIVYNASNVAYNAFLYTSGGIDYYYVLDGTQTDWTDDLSSIGYSLTPVTHYIDVFFYFKSDGGSVTFSANDYWASCVIDDADQATLTSFGVPLYLSSVDNKYVISNSASADFSFEPIGLYSGVRTGELLADMSNFYCGESWIQQGTIYYGICIKSRSAYSTNSATWKCRITRNS